MHQPPERIRWLSFALRPSADTAQEGKTRIAQVTLPPLTRAAISASEEIHRRDDFVWKWAYEAISACTLSCVRPKERERIIDLKLAYAVLMTALDDTADRLKDRRLFDDLCRAMPMLPDKQPAPEPRVRHVAEAWTEWRRQIAALPGASPLWPWLSFDHETIVHAGRYALLVGLNPTGINRAELHNWNSQSFFIFSFFNIDLMSNRVLDTDGIGHAREIVHHAQNMCAIANWIGTWERELREGDISSGVVSDAFERQMFTIDEMDEQPTNSIALVRDAHVEEYWMAQWERHWHAIDQLAPAPQFDKGEYLKGLERAYSLQMLGRGRL